MLKQKKTTSRRAFLRRKNVLLFLALLALVIVFYGLALIRFKHTLG